jgi:hypothetical protein
MATTKQDKDEAATAAQDDKRTAQEARKADPRPKQEQPPAKVGDDPSQPASPDHLPVAPGTPADANAPLAAEHLDAPEDAYKQNPPPQGVGPLEQKEPPTVVLPPGSLPPTHDARGMPNEGPAEDRPAEGYQSGTAPSDAE